MRAPENRLTDNHTASRNVNEFQRVFSIRFDLYGEIQHMKNRWFLENFTLLYLRIKIKFCPHFYIFSFHFKRTVREHLKKKSLNHDDFVENPRSESHTLHTNVQIFYGISQITLAIRGKTLSKRDTPVMLFSNCKFYENPCTDSRNSLRCVN